MRNIEAPVGASAYAAGSQVWKGNSGALTASPRKTPRKTAFGAKALAAASLAFKVPSAARWASDTKSSVPVATKIAANASSMNALPAIV